MSLRSQFDAIRDSAINGQWTQSYEQMRALRPQHRAELLSYISEELNEPELALEIAENYFRKASR